MRQGRPHPKQPADSHAAAILIAMFLQRGKARMKISRMTLRHVGRRQHLRTAFLDNVRRYLDDYGLALIEVNSSLCVVRLASLEGVRAYTFKRFQEETDLDLEDEDGLWEMIEEELDQDSGDD